MPKTRPPYAAEFRQQMVDLVRSGRAPEDLAREFEPSSQTIRTWVAQVGRDAGERSDGLRTEEREVRLPRSRGQVKAFGSRHGVYINIDSCGRCGSRAQRGIQRTCGRP